jgi:hypothetical protein
MREKLLFRASMYHRGAVVRDMQRDGTMDDDALKSLITQLLGLIEVHGPRGDVVREFVRERRNAHPDFVNLAAVCVFTAENQMAETQRPQQKKKVVA